MVEVLDDAALDVAVAARLVDGNRGRGGGGRGDSLRQLTDNHLADHGTGAQLTPGNTAAAPVAALVAGVAFVAYKKKYKKQGDKNQASSNEDKGTDAPENV